MSSTYIASKKIDTAQDIGTKKKTNKAPEQKVTARSVNGGVDGISKEHIRKNIQKLNSSYAEVPGSARIRTRSVPSADTRTVNKKRIRQADASRIKRQKTAVAVGSSVSYETIKTKSEKPFPVGLIVCMTVITVAIIFVINQYIKFDGLNESLDEIEKQIAQTKESITLLEVQYEQKYDLNEIERIATEEYGMVSADSLPRKYISLTGDDVIELVESGEESGTVGVVMSGLGKTLYKIVEYLR